MSRDFGMGRYGRTPEPFRCWMEAGLAVFLIAGLVVLYLLERERLIDPVLDSFCEDRPCYSPS